MAAHRSYERFERTAAEPEGASRHSRQTAVIVAVMAAFLAVATFLANEAVKEVVTGETHRADTGAQLESNQLKTEVNEGDETLLRVLGRGTLGERAAARATRAHEERIVGELRPRDAELRQEIAAQEDEAGDANSSHLLYELAEVGLEVGIVLASVSIIAQRRWLLGLGGAAASAGVVLLALGLLF